MTGEGRTWEGGPKVARVATEVVEFAVPRHGWRQRVELGLEVGEGEGEAAAVRARRRSGCVDGEGQGVRWARPR